jgi:uncharacterized membrane protein
MKIFFVILVYTIVYIPVVILMGFMPYFTRKTESFGVGIPGEAWSDPQVKAIREKYRNTILILGTIFIIPAFIASLLFSEAVAAVLFSAVTPVLYLLMFATYLRFHKLMKRLKQEARWAADKIQVAVADTAFRQKKFLVSPLWFILYFLVMVGTVGCSYLFYDLLPAKLPLQFGLSEATIWLDKTPVTLLLTPLLQLFIAIVIVFVYVIIAKAKTQVDAENPEMSVEKNRRFCYAWSAFIVFMGLAMTVMFALIIFAPLILSDPTVIVGIPFVFAGVIGLAAIILVIRIGQGGSRLHTGKAKDGSIINRDEDKYWKLGIFYFNKEDPALFVEKRFGIGWTANFAKPLSWVLFLGIFIVLPLLTMLIVQLLSGS